MKLQVLKYFTVLAEELHFGRAAAKLAITQPPLSTAIKALEEELGVLLLQRTKTMVQLTPAGSAFLVEARRLLEGVERAKEVASSASEGVVGRLDVGFGGTLIYRDILQIVGNFRQESPGVEVVLHEMQSSEQFAALVRGELNASFAYGAVTPPPLKSIPLREDLFVLCLAKNHPRAGQEVIDLADLQAEPFVMFERDINPVNHDNVISMFSRAGIYPRFVHYTRSWMTTVSMVSEGCGMAIVPGTLARMQMAGVVMVRFAGPPVPAPGMLAWNPSLAVPSLGKFLESAARTIKSQQVKKAASRRRGR